ncbi:ROK family protein [Streptobacillus felis]|uniref:ROK family protein n=1 Tax=Streptobacillus felis TaxID=1384509 RepID=A0A7Z0PEZ4_9FUSO|nr:ROK family protein [Streptobacillus felis]NYV27513.1 ROK family protein [Streptobacillus felis]
MKYYVGVDLGGTNTKIGLLDSEYNILIEESIKTESKKGPEDTFGRIWLKIQELFTRISVDISKLEGIGLGIPGPVVNKSIVKIAANFSWGNDFNAKEVFEKISGKTVIVENDVRAIALGENLFGASKGYRNSIIMPIGTGIAAGMIINGELISGNDGAAGEIGHISVDLEGDKCGCGLTGCLERFTSAPGIVREGVKVLQKEKRGILYETFKDCLDKLEAHHIFIEARKGDEVAEIIVDNFCNKLAYGMGVLINLINPEIIVVAGGLAKSADLIIAGAKKHLPKYALNMSINIPIVESQLLDSAGVKGAASLIINKK